VNLPFILVAIVGVIGILIFYLEAIPAFFKEFRNPTRTYGSLFLYGWMALGGIFVITLAILDLLF